MRNVRFYMKLGEIIELSKGRKHLATDDTQAFRYLQIEDLNGTSNLKFTTENGVFVNDNDIIIAWDGANAGKVGTGLTGVIGSTLARIAVDKSKVFPKYLFWFLYSKFDFIKSQRTGATIPHVSNSALRNLSIPISSLPDQRRIATILDLADSIRRKNREILEKYNQLAQSVFLEMFGDPIRNDKKWDCYEIKSLGKISTGTTPSSLKSGMFGGNIPFVTPIDLDSGEPYKRFVTLDGAENSRLVNKGALLVCCIGATVGKIRIAQELCAFNQQINAIQWESRVNPIFGFHVFDFMRKEVIHRAISTTLPILKKSEFEKIKMILPPKDIQDKFSIVINMVENQKQLGINEMKKSDELFQSLLQRAFKGEL